MSDLHEFLYGDAKRVHDARVQAEGRAAARKLKAEFLRPFEAIADKLTRWLERNR